MALKNFIDLVRATSSDAERLVTLQCSRASDIIIRTAVLGNLTPSSPVFIHWDSLQKKLTILQNEKNPFNDLPIRFRGKYGNYWELEKMRYSANTGLPETADGYELCLNGNAIYVSEDTRSIILDLKMGISCRRIIHKEVRSGVRSEFHLDGRGEGGIVFKR